MTLREWSDGPRSERLERLIATKGPPSLDERLGLAAQLIWDESRDAALEEAAKVAEGADDQCAESVNGVSVKYAIAAAIRAMANQPAAEAAKE